MAARQKWQASGKLTAPVQRALIAWRDQSSESFMAAYHEAIGSSALWPDRPEHAKAMLNFFLLEKALYELEYELTYRPSWLAVPLQGVLRIIEEGGAA